MTQKYSLMRRPRRTAQILPPDTGEVVKAHEPSINSPYNFVVGTGSMPEPRLWDDSYTVYAEEGFRQNAYVYAAIMYKMRAATVAPRRPYRGEENNPRWLPQTNDLARLIAQPNAFFSRMQLQMIESLYFNLSGNSYTWIERDRNGQPVGLWPLRPDRVRIVASKQGGLKGYFYVPDFQSGEGAFPILPEDMIHIKLYDPLDDLEGMGEGQQPLRATAWNADTDNAISKFLKKFVDGGVMPTALLTYDRELPDSKIEQIKRKWRESNGGYENWADVIVLDSRFTYTRVSLLLSEMDFGEIDSRNEARILAALGVPPILIGTKFGLERSTDTNYKNARQQFWEDIMLFELRLFADVYSQRLLPNDPALNIGHDISRVPALQANLNEQVTSAKVLYDMGVPAIMALETTGVDIEAFEGGDLPFAGQYSMLEVVDENEESEDDPEAEDDEADAENPNGSENEDDESEDDDEDDEAKQQRLTLVRQAFTQDRTAVLAIIENMVTQARHEKRSWVWTDMTAEVAAYYETLAVQWYSAAPHVQQRIRTKCADWLIGAAHQLSRKNQSLSKGKQAIRAAFDYWITHEARRITFKDESEVVFEDGDVRITTGDIDQAIADAGDVSAVYPQLLNAELVEG